MLWRLLFIALIGGAQCTTSDRCPAGGDFIRTTVKSFQSYTVNLYHPETATEGGTDTCATITPHSQDKSTWWTVRLPGVYQISCVSIYSKDLTDTSMTGAPVQVHIGSHNNRIDSKICANMTPFEGGQWNNFTCAEQVSGRYVTVSLPEKKALILCEVKIYGKRKDLINTTNSITSQSSNYRAHGVSYSSGRATDGNETLCANTNDEQKPWWRIDLLGVYNISGISIYNVVGDNTNMDGAQIRVGNSRENNGINNKMCTKIKNFNRGQWNDFPCTKQVSGRYVTVSFPDKKALILCEVEIYGKKRDPINTANSITSQSSNYTADVSYSSGRATDGNKTACAHTEDKQKPWWRIDLLGFYDISGISIYNTKRTHTNMTGAQIHVGNSRENNGINNKICANMTPFIEEQWNNYTCAEQVSGRYVTVSFPETRFLILCEVEIYGKRKDLINTANSITSQSSNHTDNKNFSYSSGRAIDGNESACAHTEEKQGNPWWRVYLLGVYNISGVSIYSSNRDHVDGAQIHIGNSRENNGTNNKMCTEIENFKGGEWNDFRCTEHVSGRYVTVSLPGERHLILCEVEIYGKKRDLINTTNSITSQSSDYTDGKGVIYSSGRATDGNEAACAHTIEMEAEHWWRIDLLGVYNISVISIYNTDADNTDITRAQIHIGNSRENNGTNNKICANMTPFIEEQWNNYTCAEQVSGRYVTVSFPGTEPLVLCEVEIYGNKKASPFKLIKKNKTWEHALEYCRGKDMDLATILDEDDQTLAELEARRADTPFLWLGLHYTCILEVWFWVADHRLEFNRWAPGEKTGDCDRSAVMERAEGHKWFSKSDYAEFNFICQKF
ncbi:uncharacterized protein LOC115573249 [Sparus aurata]|uniref:uncharacterized protein LOC115573249 n=1 Tax=Sparus aurata TaxID=8175 RepID=UPI0011C0E54F|nr:uncharacterized protein LOC115573249 [Sparus aurata]